MANNTKNLKPIRDTERARELGKKGGYAKGENARKRKALRESMELLLNLPIADTKDYNKVAKMGIPLEAIDNSQLIVLALFNRAKSGDVYAIDRLLKMIGEDGSIANESALQKANELLGGINGVIK